MSEDTVKRRNLLRGGVKSLSFGAAAAALSGGFIAASVNASNCGAMSRDRYLEYLNAFNRDGRGEGGGDFERFYTDDVLFERGQNHTMRGKKPIVDFYKEMFQHVRQELVLLHYAATETFIASEVESRFTVFKDWKHESGLFLKKGREFASNDFMHYTVHDGFISHVRLVNFRRFNDNEIR